MKAVRETGRRNELVIERREDCWEIIQRSVWNDIGINYGEDSVEENECWIVHLCTIKGESINKRLNGNIRTFE